MGFLRWPRKKRPNESPVEQPEPVVVAEQVAVTATTVAETITMHEQPSLYDPQTKVALIEPFYISAFGTAERAIEVDAIKRQARLDQNANNAALTGGA